MTSLPFLFPITFLYHYKGSFTYAFFVLLPFSIDVCEPKVRHIFGDEDGMASTGTLGRVDEYDGTKDDWP